MARVTVKKNKFFKAKRLPRQNEYLKTPRNILNGVFQVFYLK